MTSLISVLVCGVLGQAATPNADFSRLFNAIRIVETGAEEEPHNALGDGGKSLGPYQISRKYLADSGLRGDWRRCRDRKFSEAVMLAYWKRHCPHALIRRDYQTLARVHNGGPNGHRKAATIPYWRLVQGILRSDQVAVRSANLPTRRRGRCIGQSIAPMM
jgi:hypothetical protein